MGRIKNWIESKKTDLGIFFSRLRWARSVMSRKKYMLVVLEPPKKGEDQKEISIHVNNASAEEVVQWCKLVGGAAETVTEMDSNVEEVNRIINNPQFG